MATVTDNPRPGGRATIVDEFDKDRRIGGRRCDEPWQPVVRRRQNLQQAYASHECAADRCAAIDMIGRMSALLVAGAGADQGQA